MLFLIIVWTLRITKGCTVCSMSSSSLEMYCSQEFVANSAPCHDDLSGWMCRPWYEHSLHVIHTRNKEYQPSESNTSCARTVDYPLRSLLNKTNTHQIYTTWIITIHTSRLRPHFQFDEFILKPAIRTLNYLQSEVRNTWDYSSPTMEGFLKRSTHLRQHSCLMDKRNHKEANKIRTVVGDTRISRIEKRSYLPKRHIHWVFWQT